MLVSKSMCWIEMNYAMFKYAHLRERHKEMDGVNCVAFEFCDLSMSY